MRVYEGRPWAFDDHYARLVKGGEVIGLVAPEADVMRRALDETIGANELDDAGVRVTVTAGAGPADPQSDPDEPPNVLVTAWPLRDYSDLYENGAALVTIAGGGRPLAGVKTTSYAVSVAGRVIARRSDADDALFVGEGGCVLEATGSNLFVLRGNELVTPPLSEAVLPGVTRRWVLDVAREVGLSTVEEALILDDLYDADEVVLTSSLREVYPARSVDGRELSRGGVVDKLRDAYHAAVLRSL
jgi:branched-chain amino acid aminotransferase